jgi:hypothetical protein
MPHPSCPRGARARGWGVRGLAAQSAVFFVGAFVVGALRASGVLFLRERSNQTGSRAAVLRRNEGTRFRLRATTK